jgi:putative heme-binding domain-containing protein
MQLRRWLPVAIAAGVMSGAAIIGAAQDAAPAGRGQGATGRGAAAAAVKNPLEGDAAAIAAGAGAYSSRCASCHSANAKGTARGSDLTALWAVGGSDVSIFQSVRRGLADTLLPHSFGPDREVWTMLAYLRTIAAAAPPSSGNPEAGRAVFSAECSGCHQVDGKGGRLGPDLSRVGASRSRPLLAHKIRHPSAYITSVIRSGIITDDYRPITLITRDGQRIRGVKKNEDAFSIQIMDAHERIQGYPRSSLREVVNDTVSLMPDFGPDKIGDRELDDLLAYLGTLRVAPASRGTGQ